LENRARVVVFGQALIQFESTFRRLEYTWGHNGVGYGLLQCLQNGIASDQEPQGPFFFAPTEHSTFFRLSPDAILGKARAVPTFCNCPNAVGSGLALGASSYHQRVLCRGHRPCTSTGTLKKKTHAHNAESWKLAVLASWKLQRAHGRQRVVFARCGRGTICSVLAGFSGDESSFITCQRTTVTPAHAWDRRAP